MHINDVEAIWEAVTPLRLDWIQVEVSAACDAACTYCVQRCFKDQWGGGLMDMQTFDRLRPAFRFADLVFLQGWGEPLLHPRFLEMVRAAKSAGARAGFTTNGVRLTDTLIERLFEERLDIIGISLAGADAATHETFRPGCDFARIDGALRRIKMLKAAGMEDGPGIHLAFLLLRSNWRGLSRLPGLAAEWGASQIVVSHLSFIGTAALRDESMLLCPELWPEVEAMLEKAKEAAASLGILFHYYRPHMEAPCSVCTENVLNACFVSYRGDVSPCVMANISLKPGETARHFFQDRIYPVETCVFGNIHASSLREIWKGEAARGFRRAFKDRLALEQPGMLKLPAPCRRCYKLMEQ